MAMPQREKHVLYPNHYVWYVFASCLDIFVTHVILNHLEGTEVNKIADHLIERFGVWGLVGLKFSTVAIVVCVCETIGRKRPRLALNLARFAIVVACFPVGVGLIQVWAWLTM